MNKIFLFSFFLILLSIDFCYAHNFTKLTPILTLSKGVFESFIYAINNKKIHSFVIDGRGHQDVVCTAGSLEEGAADLEFNAVFDGHGGARYSFVKRRDGDDKIILVSSLNTVANLLSRNSGEGSIYANLAKRVNSFRSGDEESIVSAVKSACNEANGHLTLENVKSAIVKEYIADGWDLDDPDEDRVFDFGSTFTGMVEVNGSGKIIFMNVGDSPVFVIDKQGNVHVSQLHNASNATEVKNWREKKGYFDGSRFYYGDSHYIAVSRDFGWVAEKCKLASAEPDVYCFDKKDIAAVLLMSDGPCDNWNVDFQGYARLYQMPFQERQKRFIGSFIEKLTSEAISNEKNFKEFLEDNQRKSHSKNYDDCALIINNFSGS